VVGKEVKGGVGMEGSSRVVGVAGVSIGRVMAVVESHCWVKGGGALCS